VMYLTQSWRLKNKLPPSSRFKLPSLEWLQTATSRALLISMLLVGVGVIGGVVRNYLLLRSANGGLRWSDPTIWSSAVLLGWLVAAVAFNALYRPSREGRKVAYLTVASFGFLLLTLAVTLLLPEAHTKVGWRLEAEGWRQSVGWVLAPTEMNRQTTERVGTSTHPTISPCHCASVVRISPPTSDLRPPTLWRFP